jgi:RimJ/RimL family protein N-acetyltransferase
MANVFKSARLTYRAMEENDEDDAFIHSLRLESQSRAMNETSIFKPVNKASSAQAAAHYRDDFLLAVLICLPEDGGVGKPIGRLNLHPEPDKELKHHRNADIGIQLKEEYQGKGYGTEAIKWVLEWAFKYGGLHRVGISSSSYNPVAKRLYERLGFVYEGSQREALWFDGGWHDIVLQSMLEDEWRQRQQKT